LYSERNIVLSEATLFSECFKQKHCSVNIATDNMH
jgi:hypothetical protein